MMIMIMNLYSAKTIEKYPKALYIRIKLKSLKAIIITTMIRYAMTKTKKINIRAIPTN